MYNDNELAQIYRLALESPRFSVAKEKGMPKVTYIAADMTEYTADIPAGLSVMEGALNEGVPGIDGDCGGACSCATCHVKIPPEWAERVGKPNTAEAEMLEYAYDVSPSSRLSCQITMSTKLDGLVVQLPERQR